MNNFEVVFLSSITENDQIITKIQKGKNIGLLKKKELDQREKIILIFGIKNTIFQSNFLKISSSI